MFIDENSSPTLRSLYEKGKEEGIKEGIKEGLEKAAVIAEDEHLNDKYKHGCTNTDAAEAIRKEIT